MKKEWFTAKELVGVAGLPKTPQAVNQRARNEKWSKRKRLGVQGKALEYHISSLPAEVCYFLEVSQQVREQSAGYVSSKNDPFTIWLTAYNQFTPTEREKIINLIVRNGISGLIRCIEDELAS